MPFSFPYFLYLQDFDGHSGVGVVVQVLAFRHDSGVIEIKKVYDSGGFDVRYKLGPEDLAGLVANAGDMFFIN